MISIRSLNKYFNKGRQNEIHVINNVNLELPEKGMVAIFGKSGCGKTTLLNVIGGLDRFQSGSLTLDGQDIRRDTDGVRNRLVGYIFQNYNLNKEESCFDNVADALRLCGMTDRAEIETRTMAALANVGMDHYRARTPDTLSGGQQQRIAIARAIVKNPRIILADEPTGNLDETNTILIMDLLKQISRDHLVLLVTHEANLVDYYCDRVIELRDGCVTGVRDNEGANGFAARDKNDIFLGELERRTLSDADAQIEYYGPAPSEPVRLRIVNSGGRMYLQVETPRVQVLDETSEVRLREGVFAQEEQARAQSAGIDMSKLPPVQGSRYGRLFSFGASVKSGYLANFHRRKKGKKLLQTCMAFFSAILVLMSALFGTAFRQLIEADAAYSHNTFYVYTDADVSARLNAAVGDPESGIDSVRLLLKYPRGDDTVSFRTGSFETFSQMNMTMGGTGFSANTVRLERSLGLELPLVAGRNTDLDDADLLITTAMADTLLEKSSLGYITEYRDLLGLITTSMTVGGRNMRIAGVVESDESAVYVSEAALSQYALSTLGTLNVYPAADYGIQTEAGEAVLLIRNDSGRTDLPAVGDTIRIHGREIRIAGVLRSDLSYEEWCADEGVSLPDMDEWLEAEMRAEHPDLEPGSPAYDQARQEMENARLYEYYAEVYYAHADAYLRWKAALMPEDMYLWIYAEKGIEEVRYWHLPMGQQLYWADCFYQANGRYPTAEEMSDIESNGGSGYPDLDLLLENYRYVYENEYYNSDAYNGHFQYGDCEYLVNGTDYQAFSRQIGPTHPSACLRGTGELSESVTSDTTVYPLVPTAALYTVVHSTDPACTRDYLAREFADLHVAVGMPESYLPVIEPEDIYNELIQDQQGDILSNLIVMAVLLVLMSVCMYFIMRSALMSRIKEVGIYRAIGVSRRNLAFRFFIESLVLTTLTVFIGFLISSAVMRLWFGVSPLMTELFFYPLWMAGGLLVILYAVCLFCGTVPVLSLLHKTPSEILAKYDI